MDQQEQLHHNLTNHPPIDGAVEYAMERVRRVAKELGDEILATVPPGREQSLALTNLEQTTMWAIAGVARNQERIV